MTSVNDLTTLILPAVYGSEHPEAPKTQLVNAPQTAEFTLLKRVDADVYGVKVLYSGVTE